ncbi:MAG: hypothetical protein R6V15_16825, partial [Desulfotignum sp.]
IPDGYQKFDKSGTILPPAREEVVGRPSAPRTMMSYVDSRKPFDLDAPMPTAEIGRAFACLIAISMGFMVKGIEYIKRRFQP